jgi:hypothetical protein
MHITATSISEFWYLAIKKAIADGYRQDIARGSFAGDSYRVQLPFLAGTIASPLFDSIPVPPVGWPVPATHDSCVTYYHDYILQGRNPSKNEQYTYATRISSQLPVVMDMLKDTPETNQASIIVGSPDDVQLEHPACLRAIDFKVVSGQLEITSFWRSHDLYNGLPENLNGMAMLQRDVAEYAGLPPGRMHYSSSGGHLYGYILDIISG